MQTIPEKGTILFVAAEFPPLNTVATIRNWNLATQLARRGWNVTVLTIPPSLWRHRNDDHPVLTGPALPNLHFIHAPPPLAWLNPQLYSATTRSSIASLVDRLLSQHLPLSALPVHAWYFTARRAACAHMHSSPHVVLGSGGPLLASFLLAYSFARRYRIPYVLDYRDLWTVGNPHKRTLHNSWQRPIERHIAKRAAAIVTVSHPLLRTLRDAFRLDEDRLHVITNGYNPAQLNAITPLDFPEPAIVYAGTLYPPIRTLEPLFAALQFLDRPQFHWRFHYYGPQVDLVERHAAPYGLLPRIVCHGKVPWSRAVAALKGAHCAVAVVSVRNDTAEDQGILTGKLFELLGLGVPILLIAPTNAEARQFLFGHGQAYSAQQVREIADYLYSLIGSERKRYSPPQECSWDTLGTIWDSLLDRLIRQPR
mgnify:CR=1 FL=1|jgi:glycosyltransferase involved in cell wall biosynthesis